MLWERPPATSEEAMSSNLYEQCDIYMRKIYYEDVYVSTESQEQGRKPAKMHPLVSEDKALNH